MKSINRFTIQGNIGSITPFDKNTKINIATKRAWADEKGEKKEITEWVQVTILDERQAAWVTENAKVGDVITTEGRIVNNSYKRNSETVYTTDLIASLVNVFPKK